MPRVLLGLPALFAPVASAAHPGHEPVAISGTLDRVLAARIEVATFDTAGMQPRTLSLVTDQYMTWKIGKKTVTLTELAAGTPVVASFTRAEREDGTEALIALEIRGPEVKKTS